MRRTAVLVAGLVGVLGVTGVVTGCTDAEVHEWALHNYFPGHEQAARNVAQCESHNEDHPANEPPHVHGWFQIHDVHRAQVEDMGMSWGDIYNPLVNAKIASVLSKGGSDWSAWSCKP